MSQKKYAPTKRFNTDQLGLPDYVYQEEVVSRRDKIKCRQIILQLKQTMLGLSMNHKSIISLCRIIRH